LPLASRPEVVDVVRVLEGERRNDVTVAGDGLDQVLLIEPLQRGANRGAAEPKALGQLLLGDLLTRIEIAANDRPLDPVVCGFRQRALADGVYITEVGDVVVHNPLAALAQLAVASRGAMPGSVAVGPRCDRTPHLICTW
jgi:hypothetical protein